MKLIALFQTMAKIKLIDEQVNIMVDVQNLFRETPEWSVTWITL